MRCFVIHINKTAENILEHPFITFLGNNLSLHFRNMSFTKPLS